MTRRLVMSRDHDGWRQQQQQQRRREPGITVSLHPRDVTKYLYPAIIHCSVRTPQPCVIQYQCSLLPSELSAPPQHSNIQQKSDLLTPGLPHSHCTIHCTIRLSLYILLRTWLDLPSSILLDRPGLRPGCDTEALAISCFSISGEMHFLEAGSRDPSFAAFWDLG